MKRNVAFLAVFISVLTSYAEDKTNNASSTDLSLEHQSITITNKSVQARPSFIRMSQLFEEKTRIETVEDKMPFNRVRVSESAMRISFPFWLEKNWKIFGGIDYQVDRIMFSSTSSGEDYIQNCYNISTPLRVIRTANKKWSQMIIFSPGIYSDMDGKQTDNLRYFGMGLLNYSFWGASTVSVGIAYGSIFGEQTLFPVIGATFRVAENLDVSAIFPRPSITYLPSEKLKLSAFMSPAGNEWSVKEDFKGTRNDYILQFKGWRAGISTEYLFKYFRLNLACGIVFGRKYELVDDNTDETLVSSDARDTFFIQFGLGI